MTLGVVRISRNLVALILSTMASMGLVISGPPALSPPPLSGHEQQVVSISWTPDGGAIVSGSFDRTVRVWDAKSHQQIGAGSVRLGSRVLSVVASPNRNSSRVLTGDFDGVSLWTRPGGPANQQLATKNAVGPLAVKPNSKNAALASAAEKDVQIWDLAQNPPKFKTVAPQHTGNVTAIGWSGDGTRIGSADGVEIHVSDDSGGLQGRRIKVPTPTRGLSFLSKDKNTLISVHEDGYGRLWDLSQAKDPKTTTAAIKNIAASADGKRFATFDGTTIQYWRASGDKDTAKDGTVNPGADITTLALSQDGAGVAFILKTDDSLNFVKPSIKSVVAKSAPDVALLALRVATAGTTGMAAVADKKGKISTYPFDTSKTDDVAPVPVIDVASAVSALAFHPTDGKQLFFADPKNHAVKQFFLDGSKATVSFDVALSDTNIVLAISSDGFRLAAGTDKNMLKVWSISTPGASIMSVDLGHPITSVGLSADGDQLVTVTDDKTVSLWDVATKQRLENFEAFDNLAATPTVARIVSNGAGIFTTWTDGVRAWTPAAKGIFDPGNADTVKPANAIVIDDADTSALIAYGGGEKAELFNLVSKNVSATLPHAKAVNTVIFDPKNRIFVTGSDDKQIKTWDSSGTAVKTFTNPTAEVRSLAIDTDGNTLLAGLNDKTVQVIDLPRNKVPQTISEPADVRGVAFLPDQTLPENPRLAVGSGSSIDLWSRVDEEMTSKPVFSLTKGGRIQCVAWISNGTWPTQYVAGGVVREKSSIKGATGDRTVGKLVFGDVADGSQPVEVSKDVNPPVLAVAAHPTKDLIATTGTKVIQFWTKDGHPAPKPLQIAKHADTVNTLAFSPDGTTLASGSTDSSVRLWKVDDLSGDEIGPRLEPAPNPATILGVAFSPDGKKVAAVDENGQLIIWNMTVDGGKRKIAATVTVSNKAAFSVAWSPDGKQVAVASQDSSVYIISGISP